MSFNARLLLPSLPPSLPHSAALNLCSLLPAQHSRTTHSQGICSGLSPFLPSPVCSACLFPPPFYETCTRLVYTVCSRCAWLQHGQLVRGACWALAKPGQKLQLKCDWRASPHCCDNTQKTAFKVRIKGSPCKMHTETPPPPRPAQADGRATMGTGEENPLPVPRFGRYHHCCVYAGNSHTGKRSLQGLTHNAISVTDFRQERLHLSCVCHILFPRPFPASAATCEAAPLGRGLCPHRG